MSDSTIHSGGGANVSRDVNTGGGKFVGGDDHSVNLTLVGNYSSADLERVLDSLHSVIASPQLTRGVDLASEQLILSTPESKIVLSKEAAKALLETVVTQRRSGERDYLTALSVHPRYGRWATQFVPLAGMLTQVQHPPGWDDLSPEFTLLQLSGEGPQRQLQRIPLDDITQAIEQHPAIALLGAPGAGKSTTLYKLAYDAARQRLDDGDQYKYLPLYLTLADYRHYPSPYDFVEAVWRRYFGEAPLGERLRKGELFLFIDSLNEMPFDDERDYRQRVDDWRKFQQEHPGNRMIFACRSRDYSEPLGLPQVEIDPLNEDRIHDFLNKYLPSDLATTTWRNLQGQPLMAIVSNPYYLQMLTYLVARGNKFPATRAELFTAFVELLLGREKERHHADWFGVTPLRQALTELAERLQPMGEGTRLPRAEMLQRIPSRVRGDEGERDVSPKVVMELGIAATLLDVEKSGDEEYVRFYHQQVQEYFTARALVERFKLKEDLTARWRRPRLIAEMPAPAKLGDFEPLPPLPTTGWEEPTVLAAGLAPDPATFIDTIRQINPSLAARCVQEGLAQPDPTLVANVRADLLAEMRDPKVHLRARVLAGSALGKMGDPRFKQIEVNGVKVVIPPLVRIPAGGLQMGTGFWQVMRLLFGGFQPAQFEIPRHKVNVSEFWIWQYPLTNLEYGCFIKAKGYQNESYWRTDAARAWLRGEQVESGALKTQMDMWRAIKANPSLIKRIGASTPQQALLEQLAKMEEDEVRELFSKQYADRRRDQPAYWNDERYNNHSYPVVGVNWFEANAYCAWLDEQIRLAGVEFPLLEKYTVRLPTEAEWERAARMERGWVYPWGNQWDGERANTEENHLPGTSPVGIYPRGATPEGVHDLSGNVWEWMASRYEKYPYRDDERNNPDGDSPRVVRGGSFIYVLRLARCAFRDWFDPDYFYFNSGFRPVVSTGFVF